MSKKAKATINVTVSVDVHDLGDLEQVNEILGQFELFKTPGEPKDPNGDEDVAEEKPKRKKRTTKKSTAKKEPPKRKKTKRKVEDEDDELDLEADEDLDDELEDDEDEAPSEDDVTKAMRTVYKKLGKPKIKEILGEFKKKSGSGKAARIQELRPKDYAAVIARVEEALEDE